MVAMIAISSVVYSLLTRIKNRYGLLASFEGPACSWVRSILFWIIDKGRVLPDISNYPYLGLFLVIRCRLFACRPFSASEVLLRSSVIFPKLATDSEVAEGGGNEHRRTKLQAVVKGVRQQRRRGCWGWRQEQ